MKPIITVETKRIDVLPMVKYYISELGVYAIFNKHIPKSANGFMAPAQSLSIMIINILFASRPVYKIEEWLAEYTDGMAEEGIRETSQKRRRQTRA